MKISNRKFFASFLLVSALLAGGASFYASSSPDGLEKVAEDVGFIETAEDHTFGDFTLSDYGILIITMVMMLASDFIFTGIQ